MYCLDANVWIYFLDSDLPEHDAVHADVAEVFRSKPLFTTTILQMEVIHYLANQLPNSEGHVERILSVEDTTVAELRTSDVERATTLLTEHPDAGIAGRDATVLAAMERHDASQLWTHDGALKRMDDRLAWLDVTDPVTA